jgi:protein-disulfide isomerase
MSDWLFERRGVFRTTRELTDGIRSLGYDPSGFVEVMSGPETAARVRADCQEAQRLGLFFTPMIFINGVELRGWMAPQALLRTIEQIAASDPPARSAHYDRPPGAFDKYLADWREQPSRVLPTDARIHALGPRDAPLSVVLWGDYREPISARADSILRELVDRMSDVRYVYRHYPLHPECNPAIEEVRHPLACRAARIAEAAGQIAGEAAFWRLHAWLMQRPAQLDDEALHGMLAEVGISPESLAAALASPAVATAIDDDVAAGRALPSLRHGTPPGIHALPTIFVQRRYVPRWTLEGREILSEILRAARADVVAMGPANAADRP